MSGIVISIINKSTNPLPSYATAGSSGMDLRAHLPEPVELKPMERMLIPTGLFMKLPPGFEAQVRPRSGLAINHGVTCLNTPGTIDNDYRGEVKVILINLGTATHTISNGDRIAQLVINKVEQGAWHCVEMLDETERGAGGFGHTGKQ